MIESVMLIRYKRLCRLRRTEIHLTMRFKTLDNKLEAANLIVAHRAGTDVAATDPDHAEWERASAVHIKRYGSGEEAPAGRQAEARVMWSASALCVRFDCRQ